MARRRHQNPKPKRHGNQWRILVRKDVFDAKKGEWARRVVPEVLGETAEINFRQAQERAAKLLGELNQQPRNPSVAITFGEFVADVYRKIHLPLQSKAHVDRYESILKCHLLPVFGNLALFDLERTTSIHAQQYFVSLKDKDLGIESLKKIRNCYSSVMAVAQQQGYISRNPGQGLKLPRAKLGKRRRPHITPQQAAAIVERIAEPYASMIYVAVCSGLLPSEIAALRYEDVLEDALMVDEKYTRGEWGAPKTEARNAVVPVSRHVIDRIHRLKTLSVRVGGGRGKYQTFKLVKSDGPRDLVFQSVRKGTVMRADNILSRHIKPAARSLGVPFVNWLCFRTSYATWLKMAGVHVRDAQAQMRHARASTTSDIYMQTAEEHQRAAVKKLEDLTEATGLVN